MKNDLKNISSLIDFKTKKENSGTLIKENVVRVNDVYRCTSMIDVPVSLVNAYNKKMEQEVGSKSKGAYSDYMIAELLVDYLKTNFMNIENFPVSIAFGDDTKSLVGTETQLAQTPPESQEEIQNAQNVQTPTQVVQPQGQNVQTPAQSVQTQNPELNKAQNTAGVIGSQEI
jgi:hypothetical protein